MNPAGLPSAKTMRDSRRGPCWAEHCRGTVWWPRKNAPPCNVACDSELNPHHGIAYPAVSGGAK